MEQYLSEFDFTEFTPVTKPVLEYKSDGNTPTIRNHYVYPADKLFQDKEMKGIYLYKIKGDYQDTFYALFDYGKFLYGVHCPNREISVVIDALRAFPHRDFVEFAEAVYKSGEWMKNVFMHGLRVMGHHDLAAKYEKYHEEQWEDRRKKDEERKLEYQKREVERQAALQKEIDDAIAKAEGAIRNRNTISNDIVQGKSIIIRLMDKYDVNPPLRTRGWIMNMLAEVEFMDGDGLCYRYWRTKNGKGSQAVGTYMYELIDKIKEAA